jgi:uncharacterized damage-inducible protein DinB
MASLVTVSKDELTRYFRHLAERVEKAARALPPEKLWAKPFPFGNSVGHLLLHLTGNLNHYIGAGIARTGYVRDRPREFTEPSRQAPAVVLQQFRDAVAMVVRTIESLDEAGLTARYEGESPAETHFGLLLVCASHMNNHVGQMAYLVQAQGHSTNEPPLW